LRQGGYFLLLIGQEKLDWFVGGINREKDEILGKQAKKKGLDKFKKNLKKCLHYLF